MNPPSELIIYPDMPLMWRALAITLAMSLVAGALFATTFWFPYFLPSFMVLLIQILLGLFTLVLFGSGIAGVFVLMDKRPLAILNQEGIWVKYYGFIPWDQVLEMAPYTIATTPILALGIRIRDVSLLSKQAMITAKWGLLSAQFFGYPHITLANMTHGYEEIMLFARKYMH